MAKVDKKNQDRRREIMDAALYCFLNFGYGKTSMDDVAKKAGFSRPLIYLCFKNKEDLFLGLFDHIMEGKIEEAELKISTVQSRREKLSIIAEILVLDPWRKISGHPKSKEFFSSCENFDSKSWMKLERQKLKLLSDILGDKISAEVFSMAMDGLLEDLPSTQILSRRLEILVNHFSK